MIYVLFFLISLILYFCAPKEFSHSYNIFVLILYVLDFTFMFIKEKAKVLSYTSLFFVVYFFVNFAYPVFIYPYDSTFILQFRYSFSPDYINVGSALSLTAYTAFICGYAYTKKKYRSNSPNIRYVNDRNIVLFTILSMGVLFYNLVLIVPQIGIGYADATVPFQSGSLFVMLESALAFLLCYKNRFEIRGNSSLFFLKLRTHMLMCSVFAGASLLLGSREYVLTLILLYVILYSYYVKPVNAVKMTLGFFVGIVAFYFVSQVRNSTKISSSKELFELKSWQNGQVNGVWNLASDLIINNRNLYVGMQYVDDPKHGYTFGYNYIPNLLSPIPFLPSLFSKYILGTTVVDLTSQQMLTYYTRDDLGESSLDYELGTNCVVDVYMAFGLLGVVMLFYLLGTFVRKLEIKMSYDIFSACIYFVLFTGIVFFCRSSFLGPIKNLVWAYWVCCLCVNKQDRIVLNKVLQKKENV